MEEKKMCACGAECDHKVEETSVTPTESGMVQEEHLFALLLALTPLAVFTMFGTMGLL